MSSESTTDEQRDSIAVQRLVRCSCGGATFTKRTRVRGVWETTLTVHEDGRVSSEGNGDSIREIEEPKTLRCDDCGKRHPNPALPEAGRNPTPQP